MSRATSTGLRPVSESPRAFNSVLRSATCTEVESRVTYSAAARAPSATHREDSTTPDHGRPPRLPGPLARAPRVGCVPCSVRQCAVRASLHTCTASIRAHTFIFSTSAADTMMATPPCGRARRQTACRVLAVFLSTSGHAPDPRSPIPRERFVFLDFLRGTRIDPH